MERTDHPVYIKMLIAEKTKCCLQLPSLGSMNFKKKWFLKKKTTKQNLILLSKDWPSNNSVLDIHYKQIIFGTLHRHTLGWINFPISLKFYTQGNCWQYHSIFSWNSFVLNTVSKITVSLCFFKMAKHYQRDMFLSSSLTINIFQKSVYFYL